MAAVAKAVHRRTLSDAIVSDDEAATIQEMAGQIMALRYRMDFERSRADKAEEELELLMVGDKKGPPKKKATVFVEEEDKVAVQSLPGQDPVQAAYIHKLERKLANSGHLLAQEHRRVARREEEEDWAVMTDTWADKLVTAAGVAKQGYVPINHVTNVPGLGWHKSQTLTRHRGWENEAAGHEHPDEQLLPAPASQSGPGCHEQQAHDRFISGSQQPPKLRLPVSTRSENDASNKQPSQDGAPITGGRAAAHPSRGAGILVSARGGADDGRTTARPISREGGGLTARFSDAADGGAGHDLEGGALSSARGSTGGGGLTARSGRSRRSSGRGAREKTGFDEWVEREMVGFGSDEARRYLEVLAHKQKQFEGLISLYAQVKAKHLQAAADATTAAQELGSLQEETSGRLTSFLSLTKKAAAAGGKAGELRQELARAEMGLKDGLNVLCCCRSIIELRPVPKGWRWSDNRSVCGACRVTLKRLLQQHGTVVRIKDKLQEAEILRDEAQNQISALVMETKGRLASLPRFVRELTTEGGTSGHYAWGLFFAVESLARNIVITGIKVGSHPSLKGKALNITVYTSSKGATHEWDGSEDDDRDIVREMCLNRSKWEIAGGGVAILPPASIFDSSTVYGAVPLKHPIEVDAGSTRAICVYTSDRKGLAIKRPSHKLDKARSGCLMAGDKDDAVQVLAGPACGQRPFVDLLGDGSVRRSAPSACFAGQLLYRMT